MARGAVADSSTGTRCWAHAAGCPQCAERLLAQEKLTAGLEALTMKTDSICAPERFEAQLRKEFRSQIVRDHAPMAGRAGHWATPGLTWMSPGSWAWAGAAAILLLSLAGLLAIHDRAKSPDSATAQSLPAPKGTEADKPIANRNVSGSPVSSGQTASAAHSVSKPDKSRAVKKNSGTPARPTFRKTMNDELATNFYPLPYGSGLPLDEGYEIVRVSLARSALVTLGVPMAAEQPSSATIKADLVLGEDGLARAIRFVE